jgi:hypothetical protein
MTQRPNDLSHEVSEPDAGARCRGAARVLIAELLGLFNAPPRPRLPDRLRPGRTGPSRPHNHQAAGGMR